MAKSKRQPYVSEQPMSYDDYARLPNDGFRYELVDSKLELMSPAPSTIHQIYSAVLLDALKHTCSSEYLILFAPIDVIFSEANVRQPDLVMIHKNRIDIVKVRGIFGTPDLVVEILSPGTFQRDRKDKLETYAKYCVPEYWVVDSLNGTLEQFVSVNGHLKLSNVYEGNELVSSTHLPCVSFTMADIVRQIPKLSE